MKSARKEILLEVTESGNLVVRPYFPLTLCFFDRFFFEFWDVRFRGTHAEGNLVFGFVVCSEVLCKETSSDLSYLVEVDVSKYPINPPGCVELGLACQTCDPIVGLVPVFVVVDLTFVVVPIIVYVVLCVPISVPVVFSNFFLRGTGPVLKFCRVIDGKGYNHVVTIKVDVKRGAGRDCPDNEESKKQEKNGNQVAKSNEILAHVCLRTVQVVCFLRRRDVFKIW
jgi:hypothetical protein